MANIAKVRRFDGSDDYIGLADGALAATVEPFTFAIIYQPRTAGGFQTFLQATDPFSFSISQHEYSGLVVYNQDFENMYSNSDDVIAGTGLWYLLAITKASGTATPRFHIYDYNGASWTHYDAGGTLTAISAVSATAEFYIGGHPTPTEQLNADLAAMGIWYGSALSDGNIETLENDIANWDALSPTGCWLFNQDDVSTAVEDRTANGADEIGRVGTTVVTPTGLTFEVGSSLTLESVLPDADVTTTGWTTTPLFSKVNDASDATVIQATAS